MGRMIEGAGQPAEEVPQIAPYVRQVVTCDTYDPRSAEVATYVADLITSRLPDVTVEHVGSTAIVGCEGRGAIDLLVLCKEEHSDRRAVVFQQLEGMGFSWVQPPGPSPHDWPKGGGMVAYAEHLYRIHIHVLGRDHPAVTERCAFRDLLRADERVRDAYVALKREIVASGITDPVAYTSAKGSFVKAVMERIAAAEVSSLRDSDA